MFAILSQTICLWLGSSLMKSFSAPLLFLGAIVMGAVFLLPTNTLAAGVNLIQNPNFEEVEATDPSRPANWQAGLWGGVQASFSYPAPGMNQSSAVSAVVISTDGTGDAKWIFDDVAVTPGRSYVYTTHYRAGITTEINARYLLSNGTYVYVYIDSLAPAADWTPFTSEFTVPDGAVSLTVFHIIDQVGELSVDSVSLLLQEEPPPPSSSSLISNHDFENGAAIPLGWSQSGWGENNSIYSFPVAGSSSTKASRVEISSIQSGDSKWSHDPVNITGGTIYSFNDQYKSDTQSEITLQYKMLDGTYTYAWIASLPPANQWTQTATYTFTAPANAMQVVVFHLVNTVGWLETDNYILTQGTVPPPTDPGNLIVNPGLDVPDPSDPESPQYWFSSYWGEMTANFIYPVADASDGAGAARVEISSIQSGDAKWIHDPVTVQPSKTYAFSVDYRSNISSELTIQYKLTDGSYSYAWLSSLPPSSAWANVFYNFTVPQNALEVTVFHLIASIGWLETDNYTMSMLDSIEFDQGMVTLVFDDGFQSVYDNAFPILTAAGIKSTQAIVSGAVTYSSYMNVQSIIEMRNAGHEIVSHSRTHAHLPQLDGIGLQSEIIGSRDDLLAMGFSPVNIFVYPYGEYNPEVRQFIENSGVYIGARSVNEGFNYTNSDPYTLMDIHVEVNTPISAIISAIDQAIADRSWVILEFHKIDYSGEQYSATPGTLQAIVDHINLSAVKTVTLSEGVSLLK